jgi:hypothetical protein
MNSEDSRFKEEIPALPAPPMRYELSSFSVLAPPKRSEELSDENNSQINNTKYSR